MRRLKLLFLVLLVTTLTLDFTIAEDGNQVDEQGEEDQADEMENDAQGEDAEVQEEENADENMQEEGNNGDGGPEEGDNNANGNYATQNPSSNGKSKSGYYLGQNVVCSDAVIQVQDIVVYCDSPGTFYYGSGKYRNSQTCQPGDKARVEIDFYIADQDMIKQAGNYALVDVYADGAYYTDSVTVYDNADLCSLSSLKKKSGNQCPYNGYYQIKTHFYWGSSDNVNEVFQPTIHIGFKSNIKKQVYDFGGANTNLCRGSTFLTWSDGIRVSYANAIGNFMKTFGIILSTILFLAVLAWFLSRRPKTFKDAKADRKSVV